MRNNRSALIVGITGAIILTVTLCMFFLPSFEKTDVSWLALFFVLISEIVLVAGSIYIVNLEVRCNKVFFTSGLMSLLFLYFFAAVILAVLSGLFKEKASSFAILQITIIALVILCTALVVAFVQKINRVD